MLGLGEVKGIKWDSQYMFAMSLIFGSLPTWDNATSTVHDLKIKRNDKDLSSPCEKIGIVSSLLRWKTNAVNFGSNLGFIPIWYLGQAFSFKQIKSLHLLSFILVEIISNTITAIITTFNLFLHTSVSGENQLSKQTTI